jgi:hypothetical protein
LVVEELGETEIVDLSDISNIVIYLPIFYALSSVASSP